MYPKDGPNTVSDILADTSGRYCVGQQSAQTMSHTLQLIYAQTLWFVTMWVSKVHKQYHTLYLIYALTLWFVTVCVSKVHKRHPTRCYYTLRHAGSLLCGSTMCTKWRPTRCVSDTVRHAGSSLRERAKCTNDATYTVCDILTDTVFKATATASRG